MSDDLKGFAIAPKLDCPHLNEENVKELIQFLLEKNSQHFSQFQCHQCKDCGENWICLECQTLACSRYVKGHMAEHNQKTKHKIALSFSDASFWCYQCESYIETGSLRATRIQLSKSKHSEDKGKLKEENTQAQDLTKQLEKLNLEKEKQEPKEFVLTYQALINGFKNNQYKKVVFLTGAGLSVAAGIPDFRSPKTGLYSQLQKYNLPFPEAVFSIDFYKKNPEPFMRLAKEYFKDEFQPTLGHKFMKKMQDLDILEKVLTQNIDDLQSKAGVKQQKLLQAHGHGRKAHCISCKDEASIQKWGQHLQKMEAMRCQKCSSLVKPDIVFFGEQLPKQFNESPQIIERADLVFIVGTSLAVVPFSFLGSMIKKDCPLVLINNEDSITFRRDKLWMKGDIQENVQKIMKQLQWI